MGTYPVPGALDVHTSFGERGLHPQTEGAVTAELGVGVHRVTCTNTPQVNPSILFNRSYGWIVL